MQDDIILPDYEMFTFWTHLAGIKFLSWVVMLGYGSSIVWFGLVTAEAL